MSTEMLQSGLINVKDRCFLRQSFNFIVNKQPMKNPKILYLEACCLKCYKTANDYFKPEPFGRQWALRDLWSSGKCDKCGEPIESPEYELKKKKDDISGK